VLEICPTSNLLTKALPDEEAVRDTRRLNLIEPASAATADHDSFADAVLHRSFCSCQLGGGPGRGARSSARRPSRMTAR
jgi:hypothetical protein